MRELTSNRVAVKERAGEHSLPGQGCPRPAPEQKATAGNNGDCHGPRGWTRERVGDLDDRHHVTANAEISHCRFFFKKEMHRRERKARSRVNEARMRGLIEQDLVVEVRRVPITLLLLCLSESSPVLPPWPPPSPHGRNVWSSRRRRIPPAGGGAARSPGRGATTRRGGASQRAAAFWMVAGGRRQTGRARGGDFFPLFFPSETELRRGAERGGGTGGGGRRRRQVPPCRTGAPDSLPAV